MHIEVLTQRAGVGTTKTVEILASVSRNAGSVGYDRIGRTISAVYDLIRRTTNCDGEASSTVPGWRDRGLEPAVGDIFLPHLAAIVPVDSLHPP